MSVAILFRQCLGLNDSRTFGTLSMAPDPKDPNAGSTELVDCLNITTTDDGCVEKIAPLVTAVTHSATITDLSAKNRLIYQDGIDTKEWNGTSSSTIGSIVGGEVSHTPIDVRVSTSSTVYRSDAAGSAVTVATVGADPNPSTARPLYPMPAYDRAFVYNSRLYAINHADPRFLQYSEPYSYDLYALGDGFIGHGQAQLDGGAIPGQMLTTQSDGVNVYTGSEPADFRKAFYPCNIIPNTLYSGYVSRLDRGRHIFLCDDGVYMVSQSGDLLNLTSGKTDYLYSQNTTYYAAVVYKGKYLAFGDKCCLEYDFTTKSLLKRSTFGVTGACLWQDEGYFATGSTIATIGAEIDTTANFGCSLTLPYSDLGAPGKKSIESLYFTGTINGDALITATDQTGNLWEREISEEWINVSNQRIKTPKGLLGNHISFKIECTSGAFRLEELRASFSSSKRSR